MLSESLALADSIRSTSVHALWSHVETACTSQIASDLRACIDRASFRQSAANDTNERWYHGGNPRRETSSRPGVRISDFVEEGCVEFVSVASLDLGPPGASKLRFSLR